MKSENSKTPQINHPPIGMNWPVPMEELLKMNAGEVEALLRESIKADQLTVPNMFQAIQVVNDKEQRHRLQDAFEDYMIYPGYIRTLRSALQIVSAVGRDPDDISGE